jgi:prophage regulatory protein
MSPDTPYTLKKADVCARLSMSARTLEGLVKANEFPPPVRMGKHVYWSEASVAAWMRRMFAAQEAWTPV